MPMAITLRLKPLLLRLQNRSGNGDVRVAK